MRQPANVNDRGHFFWCLQRPNLCNYGDSTQRRRGKWNEVVSQHCGGCLSVEARFDPQDFSPSELFIQARDNSSGISLHCPDVASRLIFALLLFHLVSDLIFCTFNILLLCSLKRNEEEFEENLLVGAHVLDNLQLTCFARQLSFLRVTIIIIITRSEC